MTREKGSRTGRCQGCNHLERVRIERLLAAGASIKGAARKFAIDYHALRRHWRNHVSAEARALYMAGAGAAKDQLEEIVADESLALIDHYRIVRGALYKRLSAASEVGDGNSLALLAGRLHENFRDCGRLTGELQRGPLLSVQNNILVNPDYTRAIARIVSAVAPYPEAREAVIAALRELDAARRLGARADRSSRRGSYGRWLISSRHSSPTRSRIPGRRSRGRTSCRHRAIGGKSGCCSPVGVLERPAPWQNGYVTKRHPDRPAGLPSSRPPPPMRAMSWWKAKAAFSRSHRHGSGRFTSPRNDG